MACRASARVRRGSGPGRARRRRAARVQACASPAAMHARPPRGFPATTSYCWKSPTPGASLSSPGAATLPGGDRRRPHCLLRLQVCASRVQALVITAYLCCNLSLPRWQIHGLFWWRKRRLRAQGCSCAGECGVRGCHWGVSSEQRDHCGAPCTGWQGALAIAALATCDAHATGQESHGRATSACSLWPAEPPQSLHCGSLRAARWAGVTWGSRAGEDQCRSRGCHGSACLAVPGRLAARAQPCRPHRHWPPVTSSRVQSILPLLIIFYTS